MKIPHVKSWCAAALAAASLSSGQAAVLVNLDATSLPVGNLATWPNTGSVTGDFASSGTAQPVVGPVGFVNAVTFNGGANFMVGPAAPASVTGTTKARSIEAWVFNPTISDEETIFAWSRRGGPDGTNMSFGYGANAVFGAVGQWGAFDVGYGSGLPAPAQWHHIVYTYDGLMGRIYVDGVLTNSKIVGQTNVYSLDGQTTPQPLKFIVAGQGNNASPYAPISTGTFVATLSLAKIRVHDAVLTNSQIASTYSSEAPTFTTPAINSFTSSTTTILPGQPVTFTWQSANASTVSLNNGVGALASASGSMSVIPPAGGAAYTLTASNGTQSVTSNIVITNPVASSALPALLHRWSFNEANTGGRRTQIVSTPLAHPTELRPVRRTALFGGLTMPRWARPRHGLGPRMWARRSALRRFA